MCAGKTSGRRDDPGRNRTLETVEDALGTILLARGTELGRERREASHERLRLGHEVREATLETRVLDCGDGIMDPDISTALLEAQEATIDHVGTLDRDPAEFPNRALGLRAHERRDLQEIVDREDASRFPALARLRTHAVDHERCLIDLREVFGGNFGPRNKVCEANLGCFSSP